ncbi:MAG: MBL fold metallo-hydrolase [Methanomicrobiales archaeon]|nr:MBL fold metallo-hydrolase [Methanomicrobiales archaeon]
MSYGTLREADGVEISVLADNYTDILMMQGTERVHRLMVPPPLAPLAEHGLSCLVTVRSGSEKHCILMDAGVTPACLLHNARLLQADLTAIEGIILSHGHFDHFGGLTHILKRLKRNVPVTLHPDAFLDRRMNIPMIGRPVGIPRLDEGALTGAGAVLGKSSDPVLLAADLMLATGEIGRTTPFEKGFPWAEANIGGMWTVDPFHDDQGLVIRLRNKGLVVLSGCAHAGIINTVQHARKITKTDKVYAVMGGFHLTGPLFDPVIPPTVAAMKEIRPDLVIPMHCTGWKAITMFAREMPEQFVLNTVGTTYTL